MQAKRESLKQEAGLADNAQNGQQAYLKLQKELDRRRQGAHWRQPVSWGYGDGALPSDDSYRLGLQRLG